MAGEAPRIGIAFIEVKARKAADFESDARRAGQEAGKEYSKAFDREADKAGAGTRGKHIAEGKAIGEQIGDAAGKEAGTRTSKGITDSLARSRSRRERDGEAIGDALGSGADKGFRRKLVSGVRSTGTAIRTSLESDIYKGISKGFQRGLLGAAGIGALASSIGGLGTVTAGAVGALVSLSGAVGLLPGVLASAGIAAAALKIGLHDISGALSDSNDPKKYAEALKKLAPAAQSFVKAIVKLRPELKDLRNQVQQGLFKGLDKQVTNLGNRYLPILSRGLTAVTGGFNKGAIAVAKFLDSSKSSQQVAGILGNTAVASANLGKAFKPAVQGLLDLTSVGSGFLPKMSSGIGDAATKLSKFIASAHKTGELRGFIQGGIDAFKDLGSVVGAAGRIVGGIFKAGGGANTSGLEAFAGILNKVADQVGRPEFQKGLSGFFKSIGSAGDSVGGALPAVADALIALAPALSKIVAGAGTALAALLTSAANAAIKLAPAIVSLAGGFQNLAPHATAIVISLVAFKGVLIGLQIAKFVSGLIAARKAFVAGQLAVEGMTAAQFALNIALDANPIGLVVIAIAALAAGFVIAYKKSETFRSVVNAVASGVLGAVSRIIGAFAGLFGVLGHLPGKAGSAFRTAANAANAAKHKVDDLRASIDRIHGKEVRLLVNTRYRATFDSELSRDAAMAARGRAMTGGLISSTGTVRRASGGFINPRLGGPRQDNVPLLVSGGEFVVNAFATSQPGVLSLLRKINTSNQMPQKLAAGGQVSPRLSAGFNDLTASKPARIARAATIPIGAPAPSGGMSRDDLDYLLAGFARIQRDQKLYIDSGAVAGAVMRDGGRVW